MKFFKKRILDSRRISVWGLGYLGYTTLLLLQSKGFSADIHDFNQSRSNGLITGSYPTSEQIRSWSSKENSWSLDLSKIQSQAGDAMFENPVHLICFPGSGNSEGTNRLTTLTHLFLKNRSKLDDALIIFNAGETPGDIEHYFIEPLEKKGCTPSFGTLFRKDWAIEDFFYNNNKQRISGNDARSLDKTKLFLDILDIEYDTLSSIKEAEIYECSRRTMNYVLSSFINQLRLAYPATDLNKMTTVLMADFGFKGKASNIGTLGYKSIQAISSLIDGAKFPSYLTLAKDAEHTNLSTILKYADIIKQNDLDTVLILGISQNMDRKDILLSPSLILAEALLKKGIAVKLHDPYLKTEEITAMLPQAIVLSPDLHDSENDCLILMTAHNQYRYFTQKEVKRLTEYSKLVIDNTGLLLVFNFPETVQYHIPGDGKLKDLEA